MAQRQPKKIAEIKDKSWMGGLSLQPYLGLGGLFEEGANFNPFERMGIQLSSRAPVQMSNSATVNFVGLYCVGARVSNSVGGFLCFGEESCSVPHYDSPESSEIKVFEVNPDTGVVVNRSSVLPSIDNSFGAFSTQTKVFYAGEEELYSTDTPLSASPTQTPLLTGMYTGHEHPIMEGPDSYIYVGDRNRLSQIKSFNNTSDVTQTFLQYPNGTTIVDLENDGQYLVIAGFTYNLDPVSGAPITPSNNLYTNKSFISFLDPVNSAEDIVRNWIINNERIAAIQRLEGNEIMVFGVRNIYLCSIGSPPKVIMSLDDNSSIITSSGSTGVPFTTGSVILIKEGVVLWVCNDKFVWGYGRPQAGLDRIFFQPYKTTTTDSNLVSLMGVDGDLYGITRTAATTGELFEFQSGSRLTSTVVLAGIQFSEPYEFAFAKVFLEENLSSGQSVDLEIRAAGSKVTLKNTSFSFATHGAKNSFIYYPAPPTSDSEKNIMFENMVDMQIVNVGAQIRRIEVWGYPIRTDQTLM